MTRRLAALILLSTLYQIETAEVPHQMSLTVVELGDNFTFCSPVSETDGKYFYCYKQSLGYMVQMIAGGLLGKITISEQFKDSGFTVTKGDTQYCLTIRNVSKKDEATYFCHNIQSYSQNSINGIFLAVNDPNQQKSVNVKQSPETASVQPGGSVTIQCSLLSKNKGNTDQCTEEHSVYWFRAESGESHPNIIYSPKNTSDEQVEKNCVYSLSKTIQSSSDAGTYYCAVITCGQILFGEGTKVDTRNVPDSGSESARVVMMLGVLLACCVTVIVVLIFCVNRKKVCEHCKGAMSDSHHRGHDRSTVGQSNDLDGETTKVNYAALHFSTRKMKRGKKKGELPQECEYSVVRDYHNQQHPSQ